MNRMTTAERRGYQQICGDDGRMLVVACDQRGSMRKVLASEPDEQKAISDARLGDTKADVTEVLASHASCVLLDPLCAVPRVVETGELKRHTGLIIGVDASGWDVAPAGGYRISRMVPDVTARRVRELGGNGGKILVYLRSDTPAANETNLETLRRTIAEFAEEDLLLVVEFLTYQFDGESQESYAAKIPELVVDASRLCLESGAKVLKIPYPGTPEACAEVTRLSRDVPWAILSAGVDHRTFLGQVEIAVANGASGVIAGRSLWKDCISLNREEQREKLETIAVPRINELRALIGRPRMAA